MQYKIYKRTDVSRSTAEQQAALDAYSLNPELPVFYDDERDLMLKPTARKEPLKIYAGSFALWADDGKDLEYFLKGCKVRKVTLVGAEENYTWTPNLPINHAYMKWQEARKAGAARRGSRKSADTRRAETAAKLAQIETDLKQNVFTTRELLDRVGIKSINTIKNHYGITREQMQGRYRAAQKRRERHEQQAN